MAKAKLRNEKDGILGLLIVGFVIFVASFIFFIVSVKREELGGILLTAMLVFISGYAIIVSVSKLIKYNRVSKIQDLVLNEKIYNFNVISERLEISEKVLLKDIQFMVDNGYLGDLQVINGEIVNIKERQAQLERLKKLNDQQKASTQIKPKSKKIVSEKCPNCGASVDFGADQIECPYCGNSLNKV